VSPSPAGNIWSRQEWDAATPGFFVPAVVVDALRRVIGGTGTLTDATSLLMHPETGLRAVIGPADQIAARSNGPAGPRLGGAVADRQRDAGGRERIRGRRPAWPMRANRSTATPCWQSGGPGETIIGTAKPDRRASCARGDGVTTAIGLWGGLSSRAGLLAETDDGFLAAATAYFAGLATCTRRPASASKAARSSGP